MMGKKKKEKEKRKRFIYIDYCELYNDDKGD